MKKIILFMIAIFTLVLVSACTENESEMKDYTKSFYDYMDTYIRIDYTTDDADLADQIADEVEAILARYHDLTNNYGEPNDETFSPNIYEINERIGEKIEIHEDLYGVLEQAAYVKELTHIDDDNPDTYDYYFDIGVGKVVDIWKAEIAEGYEDNTMTEEAYHTAIAASAAIDLESNSILLTEENGHYYIETAGDDLKLDLGAIAKGYATEVINDYLIEQGLTYFVINSGTSSFVYGQNDSRESGDFVIGLRHPFAPDTPTFGLSVEELFEQNFIYGLVNVQQTSLTTSGNFEQFVLYDDVRYHHIVSPVTKLPMQYYHTISLIANDAGLLDALSTALFSMPEEVLNNWLDNHQTELGLEVITFNYDETITTHLMETVYQDAEDLT